MVSVTGDWRDVLRDERDAGAVMSDCGDYRYRLHRTWNPDGPTVAFLMLNPSTADAEQLDPTCRRCKSYAEDWGFGELVVGNIFAVRATDPDDMKAHPNPIGPENDHYLVEISKDADLVVAAWGAHADHQGRGREVVRMLDAQLYALSVTRNGHPGHPLYLLGDAEPESFDYEQGPRRAPMKSNDGSPAGGKNRCPECEETFDAHVSRDGRQGCCPHCGSQVRGRTRDAAQGALDQFTNTENDD